RRRSTARAAHAVARSPLPASRLFARLAHVPLHRDAGRGSPAGRRKLSAGLLFSLPRRATVLQPKNLGHRRRHGQRVANGSRHASTGIGRWLILASGGVAARLDRFSQDRWPAAPRATTRTVRTPVWGWLS